MKKGMTLITLIITIIIIIILSSAILLSIFDTSITNTAFFAKAYHNFSVIRAEVSLRINENLLKNPRYTNYLDLMPITKDENGQYIIMESTDNILLYSEIKILQDITGDVDYNNIYKLELDSSDNAYAIFNEENNTFEIILGEGIEFKNTIFHSKVILDAIFEVYNNTSLVEYREIIENVSKETIIANVSINGSFENGLDDWNFHDNTLDYVSIENDQLASGNSSLNISCNVPQDEEYSIYKDVVTGNNGDLLYMAASILIPESTDNVYTLRKTNYKTWNRQESFNYDSNIIGEWQRKSVTRPISSGDSGARIYIGIAENKSIENSIDIYIDDVISVNLAALFGDNIPTEEQCDILLSKYYDGDMGKQYLYYSVANSN